MSGHSKWHNIQAKKGKADAARGKIFTKLGRELAVAAKQGSDPSTNSKLADVIAKAKAANMPNDNIKRSIAKAAGEMGNVNYETLMYEGYGVGGSAVMVTTLTDNKNRTAGDVRHIFDKYGGNLGTNGSVSFMFEYAGVIVVERTPDLDEDIMMEYALDSGADDCIVSDDVYEFRTSPSAFSSVRNYLEGKGVEFLEADIEYIPNDKVDLNEEQLITFEKMLAALEDNDDVQDIYHNVNLPDDEEEE